MRIGFVSDIHANAVALKAALDAIALETPDLVVCLGDVAADGPQPRETLELIRGLAGPAIMGNADAQLLGLEPEGDDPALARFNEASRWCAQSLTAADRAFLAGFAPHQRLEIEGWAVSLFHGSPRSFNDEIYPTTADETLRGMLADEPADLHIGGHTHFQMVRRLDQATVVNCGSTGMAYDRTRGAPGRIRFAAWAEYAIITLGVDGCEVSLRRAAFDLDAFVAAIRASGMPSPDWWSNAWLGAARLPVPG